MPVLRQLSRLSRLGTRALAGPQRIGLGSLREAVGVLPLQLEHALGVVEQRLARSMEERLLAGRVQVPKLTRLTDADRGRTSPP